MGEEGVGVQFLRPCESRERRVGPAHTFAASGDRTVLALLGVATTEAVMQQGSFSDEAQRTLIHDGVAILHDVMAGLDETAGTADDYTLNLTFAGTDAGLLISRS